MVARLPHQWEWRNSYLLLVNVRNNNLIKELLYVFDGRAVNLQKLFGFGGVIRLPELTRSSLGKCGFAATFLSYEHEVWKHTGFLVSVEIEVESAFSRSLADNIGKSSVSSVSHHSLNIALN